MVEKLKNLEETLKGLSPEEVEFYESILCEEIEDDFDPFEDPEFSALEKVIDEEGNIS
jgi:hypothetical protein